VSRINPECYYWERGATIAPFVCESKFLFGQLSTEKTVVLD